MEKIVVLHHKLKSFFNHFKNKQETLLTAFDYQNIY